MWLKEFEELILSISNVKRVELGGGDPFLHSLQDGDYSFQKMLETCFNKEIPVDIATNAVFIPKWFFERSSDYIGLSIQLNFPSPNPETYRSLTGNDIAFALALQNISLLVSSGVNSRINMVLTDKNAHQVVEMELFASSLGMPLILSPMIAVEGRCKPLSAEKLSEISLVAAALSLSGKKVTMRWNGETTHCPALASQYGLTLVGECPADKGQKIHVNPSGGLKGCEFRKE